MAYDENNTLHLPRILCLHGGGTNARIFRAQCRKVIAELKSEFRFVFAEAPFASQASPDVLSVYSQWGPFKSWLRWHPEQPKFRHSDVVSAVDGALEYAMSEDDACGATGEWVGFLGFSQDAKLAASLLYRQQLREQDCRKASLKTTSFRFGILMAGRAPLVWLESDLPSIPPGLADASQLTTGKIHAVAQVRLFTSHLLRILTVIELNLGHRVPLTASDVSIVRLPNSRVCTTYK
ncbi:hypothetical protein ACMFMG_000139 [Clarireedia jacksonii]